MQRSSDAYATGVRLLAGRELSTQQLRQRLKRRGFPDEAIAGAVTRLQQGGALDDRRVALAFARTHLTVKRHGRARVLRELEAIGVARDVAREAVAQVFEDVDERRMIADALARRIRPNRPLDAVAARRLHASLIRQGFSPDAVVRALRSRGASATDDD